MRILIATGLYPPESGGPATYTALIEKRLPAHGIEVTVVPFRTVRHLPQGLRHLAYLGKLLLTPADLIYAQDTVSVGLPAALAALLLRVPLVVRVPGDYAWEQARQRFGVTDELGPFQQKSYGLRVALLRMLQRYVVNRACLVVTPSEYMRALVGKWTDPKKVHRIYTSLSLPPRYTLPAGRPQGFLVVTIARPVPWKGLEALERVVSCNKAWVYKHVNDLPHEQAMGWLKAADVFVLNSTYEGLSHALVEALSLGTPVVATNVGGNPEVVGDAGLLIPPKDDEALYRAIEEVEQNKVATAEWVARGLVRVKQFDIEVAVAQLADLLTPLCKS